MDTPDALAGHLQLNIEVIDGIRGAPVADIGLVQSVRGQLLHLHVMMPSLRCDA